MTLYGIPPAGFRRFMVPENGREHGRSIIDAAHRWWLENRGGTGEVAIAVGTLAGLALCSPSRADGPDYGPLLIPLDDAELADALRASWNSLWASDPVLADAAGPLHAWLADPSESDIRGLADYARILVRAGLLEYCADPARCESEDLLGLLVQRMRGHGQKQARGEFFTPSIASDPVGEITLAQRLAPGAVLLEPCAGTGTMVRAAAAALRFQGIDPGLYHWWLNDIDPVNSACCAISSRLWRLGGNVTVSCGDAFGDPRDLAEPTHRRAERAIAEHERRPLLYPTPARSPYWPL